MIITRPVQIASRAAMGMLSLQEMQTIVFEQISPPRMSESLELAHAHQRILATKMTAGTDVPNCDNSAMDGYALRAEDLPASATRRFQLLGESLAGAPFTGVVGENQCVRVATGAIIPDAADTVVIQEDVELRSDLVEIGSGHQRGQHIRRKGNDIKAGDLLYCAGHRITAIDLGVLASVGVAQIAVYPRPRVALYSTGNEVQRPGTDLRPGEVYNSSYYALSAMLEQSGSTLGDGDILRDDAATIRSRLQQAGEAHEVIISTGGVSVGKHDLLRNVVQDIGEVLAYKVAIKPGKPFTFGKIGNALYFGLPGNPVSSLVTFLQLVRPALMRLAGMEADTHQPRLEAQLTSDLKKTPGRMDFQRGIFVETDSTRTVTPLNEQSSQQLDGLRRANCLIVLDEACGDLPADSVVTIEPLTRMSHQGGVDFPSP